MSEEFTLEGGGSAPERRSTGSWVVIVLLVVVGAWLSWRSIRNRPAQSGASPFGAAMATAEARQRAFLAMLPSGTLPSPYVLRGAVEDDGVAMIWMRADYRDDHAFLIGGEAVPAGEALLPLLERMGAERLPGRQIIDEDGVQPDKRPPFVEEFRTPSSSGKSIEPVRLWVGEWDAAARFADGAPDLDGGLTMALDADRELPFSLFRQAGKHWWTVVELPAGDGGRTRRFLVHARRATEAPEVGATIEFVKTLLGSN